MSSLEYQRRWHKTHPEKAAQYRRGKEADARKRSAEWRAKNREKGCESSRRWYHNNKDKWRQAMRKRNYGLSPSAFSELLSKQSNQCGICRACFVRTPHVDHDHKTGKVRGLLCSGCNTGLGRLERPGFIEAVQQYLKGTRLNFL